MRMRQKEYFFGVLLLCVYTLTLIDIKCSLDREKGMKQLSKWKDTNKSSFSLILVDHSIHSIFARIAMIVMTIFFYAS